MLVICSAVEAEPQSASSVPTYWTMYVAILTGLLGFLGSWIGAHLALSSFKRQRAFDKQLDLYEQADKSLQEMSEKIYIALTFQEEEGTPVTDLKGHWSTVQGAQLQIDRIASRAALVASPLAIKIISSAAALVQKIANETEAFDPPCIKEPARRDAAIKRIETLPDKLNKMQKQLNAEARRHLGFDSRGWLAQLWPGKWNPASEEK
jgi:hypothetical protein